MGRCYGILRLVAIIRRQEDEGCGGAERGEQK